MNSGIRVSAENILAFIRSKVPPPHCSEIGLDTDLRGNLRMAEEDAEELLAAYFREFAVHQGDFDFCRYFPPEGFWPLPSFRKVVKPVPLTARMLLLAAQRGNWESSALEHAGGTP